LILQERHYGLHYNIYYVYILCNVINFGYEKNLENYTFLGDVMNFSYEK